MKIEELPTIHRQVLILIEAPEDEVITTTHLEALLPLWVETYQANLVS